MKASQPFKTGDSQHGTKSKMGTKFAGYDQQQWLVGPGKRWRNQEGSIFIRVCQPDLIVLNRALVIFLELHCSLGKYQSNDRIVGSGQETPEFQFYGPLLLKLFQCRICSTHYLSMFIPTESNFQVPTRSFRVMGALNPVLRARLRTNVMAQDIH